MTPPERLRSLDLDPSSFSLGAHVAVFACPRAGARRDDVVDQLAGLEAGVTIVMFVPEDGHLESALVSNLIAEMEGSGADVVAISVPVVEAIKEVNSDRVAAAVDRASLRSAGLPEAARRAPLEAALSGLDGNPWVRASEVIAATGGTVVLHEPV